MASTIKEFETNKNAVIIHYPHLTPIGPAYIGERPNSCIIQYHNYSISASSWEKGFRVFKNSENLSKHFDTLKEAKQYILDKVNKQRKLF